MIFRDLFFRDPVDLRKGLGCISKVAHNSREWGSHGAPMGEMGDYRRFFGDFLFLLCDVSNLFLNLSLNTIFSKVGSF